MSANPKFIAATAHVDEAAIHPLPSSCKVYVEGSRADLRVPMREITQSDTPTTSGVEHNPPFTVYDTSGPNAVTANRCRVRARVSASSA